MVRKSRSPAYPSLSLPEAIEKAQAIYKTEYTHSVDKSLIVTRMGYKSVNGSSLTAVSALSKYGLLEGRGDLHITPLAVTILVDPPGSEERKKALREAAFRPNLFAELAKQYGERTPTEENVTAHLQKNGFTPQAAAAAAKNYGETLYLLSREAESSSEPHDFKPDKPSDSVGSDTADDQEDPVPPNTCPPRRDVFSLAEGDAVLQVPTPLSPESVEDLNDWLQLVVKRYRRLHANKPEE